MRWIVFVPHRRWSWFLLGLKWGRGRVESVYPGVAWLCLLLFLLICSVHPRLQIPLGLLCVEGGAGFPEVCACFPPMSVPPLAISLSFVTFILEKVSFPCWHSLSSRLLLCVTQCLSQWHFLFWFSLSLRQALWLGGDLFPQL